MTNRSIFLVGTVIAIPLLASDTDDPQGWSHAKWGMTREQLNTAFPKIVTWNDSARPHVGLRDFLIDKYKFSIEFRLDGDGVLTSVFMMPENQPPDSSTENRSPEISRSLLMSFVHTMLREALAAKYSSPEDSEIQGRVRIERWIFAKTQIRLASDAKPNYDFPMTTLVYSKRLKSDLL